MVTYLTLWQGDPIMVDHLAGADISAGDVVAVGNSLRIAHRDIANGTLGALSIGYGIYTAPKAAGGGTSIASGKRVYWDATAHVVTETAASNKHLGWTVDASVDADTTQHVLHIPAGSTSSAALTNASLTDNSTGTATATLAAITAPGANATTSLTTDMTAAKNAIASLAAQLNDLTTKLRAGGIIS